MSDFKLTGRIQEKACIKKARRRREENIMIVWKKSPKFKSEDLNFEGHTNFIEPLYTLLSMAEEAKARGNAALAANDFALAVQEYTNAINLSPSNHIYYSNRSAAYLSSGDTANALADAQKTVSLAPSFAKGHGRLGACYVALHEYENAVQAYEKGIAIDPQNAALQSGRDDAMRALNRDNLRENPFGPNVVDRVLSNPKFAPYLSDPSFVSKVNKLQSPNGLKEMFSGGSAQDPRMLEVLTFLLSGSVDFASANSSPEPSSASPSHEQSTSSTSKDVETPQTAAESSYEDEEAKLTRVKKQTALKHKEEGNVAYKAKRFEEAIASYKAAQEADPSDITYRLNESAVLFEQGKYNEAIETCEKAIEFGRSVMADFTLIGKAFARIGNARAKLGDLKGAIDSWESAQLEHHTEDVHEKLKKAKKDLKDMEIKAYINPELAVEAKDRGNVAFKAGNFALANAEYTEAIKRDPSVPSYYTNRASARTKLMTVSEAMADCDMAIKLDPKFAKAYARKGALHLLSREYHKALDAYQYALTLDPSLEEAKEGIRKTTLRISEGSSTKGGTAESDEESRQRAMKAMADPEIQAILSDPVVDQALRDMQENPAAAQAVLRDRSMQEKISKLVAAGILKVG
jgi:stress-induced-phosphoprotein 1